MSFNIIDATKRIGEKYKRYLKTIFDIKDLEYKEMFNKELDKNDIFVKGPYLDVVDSFLKGRSIKELINAKILHPDFEKLNKLYNIPNLYYHQEESIIKINSGANVVVSTGTGSGKTESFLIPILNRIMMEKEINSNHKISDGIKAVIIYPMNALANDQIDRLRKLFLNYSEITFGAYTGQTKLYRDDIHSKSGVIEGALSQYRKLNEKRKEEELREPLPNEILSREEMHLNPPHILITNYAMLEYLLLKPETINFFTEENTKNWNFIVMDEAHTYTGSTGIEVSMLLRRLQGRINKPNIQYILTSATLGDESLNDDVIKFAENLCSSKFDKSNIIRAKRYKFECLKPKYNFGIEFYTYVDSLLDSKCDNIVELIKNKYKLNLGTNDIKEFLYDVLLNEELFWNIKKYMDGPKSIVDICNEFNLSTDEVTSFVNVSSLAAKDGIKIFDARYHSFIRAADGVYITLPPHKKLFLNRKKVDYVGNKQYKVFETVNCSCCNALYLIGNIKGEGNERFLEQTSTNDSNDIQSAFLINSSASDEDDDNTLESNNLITQTYELCPMCAFIREANIANGKVKPSCGHDESFFVKLTEVKVKDKKSNGKVTKCIACENVNVQGNGILRSFFSGHEASTSVIGTALFEQIPAHSIEITNVVKDDDEFGFGDISETKTTYNAKQFIAFSDNRVAAAYYASYLALSYESILGNKLILDILKNNDSLAFNNLRNFLTKRLEEKEILPVEDYLKKLESNQPFNYSRYATLLILKALTDINSKNSLLGMGLVYFDFIDNVKFFDNKKLILTSEEMRTLSLVYISSMLADSAIAYDSNNGDFANLEAEFAHAGVVKYYHFQNKSDLYNKSFYPVKQNRNNKRLDYLKKVLDSKNVSYDDNLLERFLKGLWNHFINQCILNQDIRENKTIGYRVNSSLLKFSTKPKVYICDSCKKITFFNIEGVCPCFRCKGKLIEFDTNALCNNHYYKMYTETNELPLRVVEHTAQLNRDEAYKYQNLFKDQKIDILSCSTTFEMGVDVGNLETVFMRNMPPSPSNYAQRAGRAGRSNDSAAFALTFCNRSNHDFNYYDNPINMISGVIYPPQFKVDNEKIGIRHLYSSALSYFFRKYPIYFNKAKDFIDKCDVTNECGYKVLKEYLDSHPMDLKIYLENTLPKSLVAKFKIASFGWIDYLYSVNDEYEYPSLAKVYNSFHKELEIIDNEINNLYNKMKENSNLSHQYYQFCKRKNNYLAEDIISFLSKNNILPKYGFPVDTIDLNINVKSTDSTLNGIELSRDMSQAISDYAPGCQVVANNRIITSRYIKMVPDKDWKMDDFVKCRKCNMLNISTHIADIDEENNYLNKCPHCGSDINKRDIKTYLIPEFGFISEIKTSKPTMIKPEKMYHSEASFITNSTCDLHNFKFGNVNISVDHIPNGEIAVINNRTFGVCDECGYAEVAKENNQFLKDYDSKNFHKQKDDYICKNKKLRNYSIGYKFKTDVTKIKISYPIIAKNEELYYKAYSILQALILSTCKELSIENSEIAGCLEYYVENGNTNYAYILYDRTPGGAGHVKRISDKDILYRIFVKAYNLAKNCKNCDADSSCYSCLRTYQNQKYHDYIRRDYVVSYLTNILNEEDV